MTISPLPGPFVYFYVAFPFLVMGKVRTDLSTEFVSNPVFIVQIQIELVAGLNPFLIVQIRTALDRAVDFNEHVTAFTTGRALFAEYRHQRRQCRHIAEMWACARSVLSYTASFVIPLHGVTATPAEGAKN